MATVIKRGNRWQGRIYLGKNPETHKDVWSYPSWDGSLSKREVNQLLAEAVGDAAARRKRLGGHFDGRSATLNDLWEDYLEVVLFGSARPMSEETRAEYMKNWRLYLQPALGAEKLKNITPKMVDELVSTLEATPKHSRRSPDSVDTEPRACLSHSTALKVTKLLASMLSTAVRWNWIEGPHAVRRSSASPRVEKTKVRAPDEAVVRALLQSAQKYGSDSYAFFRLAAVTGARRGELCALQWSDVDLDSGNLSISKATQTVRIREAEDSVHERVSSTKTRSTRIVPLDPDTVATLRDLREKRRAAFLVVAPTKRAHDFERGFIFAADPGGLTATSKDAWSSRWRRIVHSAGVEDVRLHDLRHFVGASLARSGRPIREIMEQLGHSRLSTVEIYTAAPASSAPADVMAAILREPDPAPPPNAMRRQRRSPSP